MSIDSTVLAFSGFTRAMLFTKKKKIKEEKIERSYRNEEIRGQKIIRN